jgi:hypothetical protein
VPSPLQPLPPPPRPPTSPWPRLRDGAEERTPGKRDASRGCRGHQSMAAPFRSVPLAVSPAQLRPKRSVPPSPSPTPGPGDSGPAAAAAAALRSRIRLCRSAANCQGDAMLGAGLPACPAERTIQAPPPVRLAPPPSAPGAGLAEPRLAAGSILPSS